MAPHSSPLAWKLPWTEEPGGLQSVGSQRVGQDWATSLSLFTFMHWRRQWQPTPVFLPGESQGRRSLVGCRLGSHRVRHDWSDLAAAAACMHVYVSVDKCINIYMYIDVYWCMYQLFIFYLYLYVPGYHQWFRIDRYGLWSDSIFFLKKFLSWSHIRKRLNPWL